MDKILILGDIHGRTCWKDIIDKENPDLTIFLGDYVDSHENITRETQFKNFLEILDYREDNPSKVILLVGNHDLSEMFSFFECSGHSNDLMSKLQPYKDKFKNLSQLIYIMDDIIFSHAGITKEWLTKVAKLDDPIELMNMQINDTKLAFQDRHPFTDPYGDDTFQSPVWIRPRSLSEDMIDGFNQVVGHTPVKEIFDVKEKSKNLEHSLYLCDNLPDQYLIYEDKKFRVVNNVPDIEIPSRYGKSHAKLIYVSRNLYRYEDDMPFSISYADNDEKEIKFLDPEGGEPMGTGYRLYNGKIIREITTKDKVIYFELYD